jgi:formylglycine-generating enzyme
VRVAASIAVGTIVAVAIAATRRSEAPPCGPGFTRTGARCCPTPAPSPGSKAPSRPGQCVFQASACPAPLVTTDHGCDAPERDVVEVPATTVTIGPSDWEAEGRVVPRTFKVERFFLDRFEVSSGRACASNIFHGMLFCGADRDRDPARAAFGVSLARARDYCKERGGRLPTDDEWLAAAAGERPRRYPWGDTGAVCRRAAWGLDTGPCGEHADGPDTVGSHPAGMTPLGIHDLAGNVAEWVENGGPPSPLPPQVGRPSAGPPCSQAGPDAGKCTAIVRGGSWKSGLATELRTWLRREVSSGPNGEDGEADAEHGDPTIGFRCAYDGVR